MRRSELSTFENLLEILINVKDFKNVIKSKLKSAIKSNNEAF